MGSQKKTIELQYDSRGNRSALIDHDGGRFTYTYDAVNRITQVQNPQGDRTSFSYDDAGRRILKKLANGTRHCHWSLVICHWGLRAGQG
jgi:YD repeat-containing protein